MKGLQRFREHFAGFEDRYVLIGGSACFIIMTEVGLAFRATRDMDLVLCVETLDGEFIQHFWAFVEAGGYEQRQKSSGAKEFFRFSKPKDDTFPFMLELLSRIPDGVDFEGAGHLTPLPADGDIDSLSAIILDEAYYQALIEHTRTIEDIRVLDERLLIPFKARAFLDLSERKKSDASVRGDDIRKHRNDVFRVLQLLPADTIVSLPDSIATDMKMFAEIVAADEGFDPKSFGLGAGRDEHIDRLRKAYAL